VFVFDTDHTVIIQRQTEPEFPRLAARMDGYSPEDFYVPIVSFHEEVVGWNAYLNRARTRQGLVHAYTMFEGILTFFATQQVLPFDDASAAIFDSLREQRVRIGTMDLRIAAIALARGFTVLSRNTVHFSKVPGLSVEDWTAM
jgi:tRNA(fMet)-specific endonuclease VapC